MEGEELAGHDRRDRAQPLREPDREKDPDRAAGDRLVSIRQDDPIDIELAEPIEQSVEIGRRRAGRGDRD